MAFCISCNGTTENDDQSCFILEMGFELFSMLPERIAKQEITEDTMLCNQCFEGLTSRLAINKPQQPVYSAHDINLCFACRASLLRRRSITLDDGPHRNEIARTSHGQLPLNARVCYACWFRVNRHLSRQHQGVAALNTEQVHMDVAGPLTPPLIIPDVCLLCDGSLIGKRTHTLPEGSERSHISIKIQPRQIPDNARVCYACWVAVQRSVHKEREIEIEPPFFQPASRQNQETIGLACTGNEDQTAVSDLIRNQTVASDHSKNQTVASNHSVVSGHSKNQTAMSDRSKKQTVVSDYSNNQTVVSAVSDHSKNQTVVSDFSNNQTVVSDHSKNQTVVSDHSKNQTAVSDHSKKQTAVSGHNKNQTVVSIRCKNQPVVNIIVEKQTTVDDSQKTEDVHTHTGAGDDCHNTSDDDCEAVIDDDSSFYHNAPKRSDDKDEMEGEPQNLDKNEDIQDGFKCNFCFGEIKEYRYTCVQCPDLDLCGSCEARGAHCLHYVLRIPRPKPYTEIQMLLREIRRLLSGAHTDDVLWTQPNEIKGEELNDDFDPLDIDCVMQTSSETEDNVPEISTRTSITKSHRKIQEDNDSVPEVNKKPRIKPPLHNATTHKRHKETVTDDDDTRSAASTSSLYMASTRLAADGNTVLTIESSPQAIDNSRTPVSDSSQYTASTRLAPDGNTVLTIESSLQEFDQTRTPASESSQYTASTSLIASNRNTSSPQAIDNTRTTSSESSLFTASTSVSSDGNTVLTIATNVGDTDSASRPVPATPALHAPASITPGDTETVYNKIKITGDSRLQVPMATKRKCTDNIEASKPKIVFVKGPKKLIIMPKVIGPGTRFKIIRKPSATGQPQVPGAVSAARHRTQSTQRDHHPAT